MRCCVLLEGIALTLITQDDEDDYGGAEERGDRIDREDELMAWGLRQEVTHEEEEGAREDRRWDEDMVVGRAEEQTDEVRDGHAEEGNRPREGRDTARDDAGDDDEQAAYQTDVRPDGARIVLPEAEGIHLLRHEEGRDEPDEDDGEHELQLAPGRARHATEAPDEVGLQRLFVTEVLQDGDDARGEEADHHPDDEHRDDVVQTARDGGDHQEDAECTDAGSEDDAPRVRHACRREERGEERVSHRIDRYAHACTAIDPEDRGIGKGVAEERLHLQACDRDPCASDERGERLR